MKRTIALSFLVALVGAATWFVMRGPNAAPPSAITVDRSPARIERGKYIYEVLSSCEDCHTERNWKKFAAPVLTSLSGGGQVFPKELGLPGQIAPPNITQDPEHGLGKWTDGEIIRAVREGVSRDGRALFPMMPYQSFAKMSDEDVQSLVAYLRTVPSINKAVPKTKVDFPVSIFMKSAPQPVTTVVAAPDKSNQLEYGKYLVEMSGCEMCHSRKERGEVVSGMNFAGGEVFRVGEFEVVSANISADPETGIGNWTEQRFIDKFKGYANFTNENLPPAVQVNFTVMPWLGLRNLHEDELKAIFAYLKTMKPVRNKVESHPLVASRL